MFLQSRQCAQRFAQIAQTSDQLFDLRMCVFPDRIGLGQQCVSGCRQSETPAPAVLLVDRHFQKTTPFERFEVGRKSRAIHRKKGRDTAKRRRLWPVERHQQRELTIGEIKRPQRIIEATRQRARRAVHMQAQAMVAHQVSGGERQLTIFCARV